MMGTTGAKRRTTGDLPPRSERLFRWFRWYARRYCAKHLHAVRLAKWGAAPTLVGPAIIVMNHPSWWDPLLAYVLSGLFPNRVHWGVIESEGLRQYRFLGRAGLFGVEPGTPRGARQFLCSARAILADPGGTIWLTGQGRFADVRERPTDLRAGVGHLASHLDSGVIVPLAVELTFWEQRTPEALAAFGEPLDCAGFQRSGREWTAAIEQALESTQNRLAADAISRDPSRFELLIHGRAGVGGVYDVWRRMTAWLRSDRFSAEHQSK